MRIGILLGKYTPMTLLTAISATAAARAEKMELLAKKTCWAIEKDPKRPGKVKIVDQEHAAELLELANDYLS